MSEDYGNIHPIVQKLLVGDRMTKWLKAEVLESRPGFCKLPLLQMPMAVMRLASTLLSVIYQLSEWEMLLLPKLL